MGIIRNVLYKDLIFHILKKIKLTKKTAKSQSGNILAFF